jgi:hypothetical protein
MKIIGNFTEFQYSLVTETISSEGFDIHNANKNPNFLN